MRIAHYSPLLRRRPSGVTNAVTAWADRLARRGWSQLLLDAGPAGEAQERLDGPDVEVRAVRHALGSVRRNSVWLPIQLADHIADVDLMIVHEGWKLSTLKMIHDAVALGIPTVVMPHGVYERRWIQQMRMNAARRGLERSALHATAGVHLYFESEKVEVGALAPQAASFVAPTGFEPVNDRWVGGSADLVWIGRFSVEHKGLDLLVQAVARIPRSARPMVRLFGEDYLGGRARVAKLVVELGVEANVSIEAPIYGEAKRDVLRRCDGYLHPSRWECHSVGLLEALAMGVPTLTSTSMHVAAGLAAMGATVAVDPEPDAVASGLTRFARDVAIVGDQGRKFVLEEFDWERSVDRFIDGIDRLGISSRP